MAPTAPGTPADFRPPHGAVAYTTAFDEPSRFYGACSAGDFRAADTHETQEAARADVAEHLADVARQPHRAFVNMVREWPYGFLGFCAAGDYSPGLVRVSWPEAEADVAAHLLEMEQGAGALDELAEGDSYEQLAERAETPGSCSVPVDGRQPEEQR